MTSQVYSFFSGVSRISYSKFQELGLDDYITETQVDKLKDYAYDVLFELAWNTGNKDGSPFIEHSTSKNHMNDEKLIRLAYDSMVELYATVSLFKGRIRLTVSELKKEFGLASYTRYFTQEELPHGETCKEIIKKLNKIIKDNPNNQGLVSQCKKTISSFKKYLNYEDVVLYRSQIYELERKTAKLNKYDKMRALFLSKSGEGDYYRSMLDIFLYARDLGMEPVFFEHLKGSKTLPHHMIPEMGWSLYPSLIHLTKDKEYHQYYPKSSTSTTAISRMDSLVFSEAYQRLISLAINRVEQEKVQLGPTGKKAWVNRDDIIKIFKDINFELFGKKDKMYIIQNGQAAITVWENGLLVKGSTQRIGPDDSLTDRLEFFSGKIDFLKLIKTPDKYLRYVEQYHPRVFKESGKKAALEVFMYYRLLKGEIKDLRSFYIADLLLEKSKLSKDLLDEFKSGLPVSSRVLAREVLDTLIFSDDDRKLSEDGLNDYLRIFPTANNKEWYWDFLTSGQARITDF